MFTNPLSKLVDKLSPEDKAQWENFQRGMSGSTPDKMPRLHDAAVLPGGNSAPQRRRGRPPKERGNMTTTAQAQVQTAGSNKPSFEQIKTIAADLGKAAGLGADTGFKFYYAIVEAAYHQAIDLSRDKHGVGFDDAMVIAETYTKARGGATVFDAKSGSQRKLLSCVRQCTKLGSKASLGQGEPLDTTDNFVALRKKLRQNPANSKRLDDASNSFLRFVRAQLKSDTPLTTDVLTQLCYKKDKDVPTVDDVLEGIRRKAKNLYAGKSGPHFETAGVKQISEICTDLLKEIATARSQGANV